MIGRVHRCIPPGVPRQQLGALPPPPPVPGAGVTSPAGKAIFAGVVYGGLVLAGFAFYRYLVNIDIDRERLAAARSRGTGRSSSGGGSSRPPRKPRKTRKKSVLEDLVEVVAGDPEPEQKEYGSGEGAIRWNRESAGWEQARGDTWVPYDNPGYAHRRKQEKHVRWGHGNGFEQMNKETGEWEPDDGSPYVIKWAL